MKLREANGHMGASLFHQFHQRTDGTPETPSAQMAQRQGVEQAIETLVAGAEVEVVFEDMLEGSSSGEAYKGYLIRTHPITKAVWIEKGGHHISYAKSVDDAKRIIDDLV